MNFKKIIEAKEYLQHPIGSGTFGKVYLINDPKTQKKFAIKVIAKK